MTKKKEIAEKKASDLERLERKVNIRKMKEETRRNGAQRNRYAVKLLDYAKSITFIDVRIL